MVVQYSLPTNVGNSARLLMSTSPVWFFSKSLFIPSLYLAFGPLWALDNTSTKLYLAGVCLSGKHPVCIWRYQAIKKKKTKPKKKFSLSFFFFLLFLVVHHCLSKASRLERESKSWCGNLQDKRKLSCCLCISCGCASSVLQLCPHRLHFKVTYSQLILQLGC